MTWHEVWVRRDSITGKLHSTTGSTELSPIPPVEAIRNGARVYVLAPTPTQLQLSDEDREVAERIAATLLSGSRGEDFFTATIEAGELLLKLASTPTQQSKENQSS